MMSIQTKKSVIASLLDKLLDEEPDKKYEPVKSHHQQLNEFYQSIRRDLEYLLNTRNAGMTWHAIWQELASSLLAYGVEDFMNLSLITTESRRKFCHTLAEVILRFEPRFKTVQVSLLDNHEAESRTLYLRIEGLIYVEPAPELIILNAILQPETHNFSMDETGLR